MRSVAKSQALAVTQAKKISKDGEVTYYLSLPKIRLLDIKGRLWVWKRVRQLKKERKN